MALATSVVSARVGRGFFIIESSIWVAVMTWSPALYPLWISFFWMLGISSKAISTPMSPRATMMPSETARISSMFCTPSRFSILAMIRMWSHLCRSSSSRMSSTSRAQRVKEAAMKSNPFSMPKTMSFSSCLLR